MGLLTGIVRESSIYIEAMERDFSLAHMPMINITLSEAQYELITLPNGYYAHIKIEVEVVAYDLSEYRKASKQRDDILKIVMETLRRTTNFNNDSVDSSIIGERVTFSAGTPEQAGGHIATATFSVLAKCYVDP
jgi:hypothetical protein